MIDTNPAKIKEILTRGVEEIIVKESLEKKLKSGKVLRIKHGVDPTTSDLHIGQAVVYWRLRVFQEMGHKIVFLIGDFTGRFGDPSEELKTRKLRPKEKVRKLARNYLKQIAKIFDIKKTEVRYNSQWYDKMSAAELLKLMSHFSHQRMLERDMFQKRIKKEKFIGLHEPAYPVLQAYDSVVLKSDLTVIGTDQLFNELQARKLQEDFGQQPQDIIAMKLLLGTDGKRKMSQSLGNFISIDEPPQEQYGKTMSIPDHLIIPWFELTTRLPLAEVNLIKKELKAGKINPRDVKARLAQEIVTLYHGPKLAQEAEKEFERIFKAGEKPSKIKSFRFHRESSTKSGQKLEARSLNILDLLVKLKMAPSKAEARRLIQQKGVKIDDKIVENWKKVIKIKGETIVQVGKRRFVKIRC